jgi:hypothetical protein
MAKKIGYRQQKGYHTNAKLEIGDPKRTDFMVGEPVKVIGHELMRLEPHSKTYDLVAIVENLDGVVQAVEEHQLKVQK